MVLLALGCILHTLPLPGLHTSIYSTFQIRNGHCTASKEANVCSVCLKISTDKKGIE